VPEDGVTSAVLEAPAGLLAGPQGAGEARGRRLTLEERLQVAWRAAQRDGISECPVCRAAMSAEGSRARCAGCDSVVS
jgi:hypothetical protein